MNPFVRPPLKWAGGKFRLLNRILPALPEGKRLIEPFAGSGAVFLNASYPAFLICDLNEDLINFFRVLSANGSSFIKKCEAYFTPRLNVESIFYTLRDEFNGSPYDEKRAALFLYLNRHGYNGLIRYNAKGSFNTPFGRYVRPYFPQKEMEALLKKCQTSDVTWETLDFRRSFSMAKKGDVIYCDPPYVPLSMTSNFTAYAPGSFGPQEQKELALCARQASRKGCVVVVSNHDTETTRELYADAHITSFDVRRFISCDGTNRNNAKELLAVYNC